MVVRERSGSARAGATRSYPGDGRVVEWTSAAPEGWRIALDAERLDRRIDPVLAARLPGRDPLREWTRFEVIAKLTDVPVALLLRQPSEPAGLRTIHRRRDGLMICLGVLPGSGDAAQ